MDAFRKTVVLLLMTVSVPAFAGAPTVEHVTAKPVKGNGTLGTSGYSRSKAEEPWFQRLTARERVTGGMMSDYELSTKDGVFVGWFGVVRKMTEEKGQTTLLVEHKCFDGATDTHILALDFNGGGDFVVRLPGVGHKIERLSLVKVYGVAKVTNGLAPELKAEFVRNWHWGTFTFIMAAGTQHGSDAWRKLNTVELDRIYDPYPDDAYYERRLGKR